MKNLGIISLKDRRDEICLSEMFKIMRGFSDVDRELWFKLAAANNGGTVTRMAADELNVKLPPARLELRKQFFSVRTCELWNRLPSEVKRSKNVKTFKWELKKLRANNPA